MVSLAEDFIARNRKTVAVIAAPAQATSRRSPQIAPIVRGACSVKDENIEGAWRRLVLEFPHQRRRA